MKLSFVNMFFVRFTPHSHSHSVINTGRFFVVRIEIKVSGLTSCFDHLKVENFLPSAFTFDFLPIRSGFCPIKCHELRALFQFDNLKGKFVKRKSKFVHFRHWNSFKLSLKVRSFENSIIMISYYIAKTKSGRIK